MNLDDQFSFYTVIPRVRDPSNLSWSNSCCNGNWRVKDGDNWITLTPENTRVRDSDNSHWLEICQGHIVEVTYGYPYDCNGYSLVLQETRSRAGTDLEHVAMVQNSVFGEFLAINNSTARVVIVYNISNKLRVHIKDERIFNDFLIDTVGSISASLSVLGDYAYVNNDTSQYAVNLVTGNISESALGYTNVQAALPTTNAFYGPVGYGTSEYHPGYLAVNYNNKIVNYPLGDGRVAYAVSTPEQSYILEVYGNEFHFARTNLAFYLL